MIPCKDMIIIQKKMNEMIADRQRVDDELKASLAKVQTDARFLATELQKEKAISYDLQQQLRFAQSAPNGMSLDAEEVFKRGYSECRADWKKHHDEINCTLNGSVADCWRFRRS